MAGICCTVVFGHTAFSAKDSLMTEGDVYKGKEGSIFMHSVFSPPDNINVPGLAALLGGNVLGRWSHVFSSRRDMTVLF